MKTISPRLAVHLKQNQTTIAFLYKVIRTDGTIFGFTNHDEEIIFTDNDSAGTTVTYEPYTGITPSATDTTSDMQASNMEVVGFLESDRITNADLIAGLYDYARIEIRLVNWADLTMGALQWKNATLGQVKTKNGTFTAELRGLEFYLGTNIGETYGPTCRVDLGSARCGVNLADYIQNGTVMSVTDLRTFVPDTGLVMRGSSTPTDPAPASWFNNGVITFVTGLNAGYAIECNTWDGTTLTLFENLPFVIAAGDTFTIEPGCDMSTGTNGCGKFDNIQNFVGEPFIPGQDQLMIYPNADGSISGSNG